MTVKEKQNPFVFLATYWNLSSKSGDLGHFFHEKSFVLVEIIFFRLKFGENSPLEESLVARVAIINNKIWPQLVTEQIS
jgi:hypothetical protein